VSDTITADGRVIPLSELERVAEEQPCGADAKWLAKHGIKPVVRFDRETCLALVAEVRRQAEEIASLRERVAELEACVANDTALFNELHGGTS